MEKFKKRWEFVGGDTIEVDGRVLTRIRALVDVPDHDVIAGDLGGYVEKEENLPHNANGWVADEACVYECARVVGNALASDRVRIFGHAVIDGNAIISDDAYVFGNARVDGDAWVFGCARVLDNARVGGHAWVYGDAWVCGAMQICGERRIDSAGCSVNAVLGRNYSGMRVHLHSLLASVRGHLESLEAGGREDDEPNNALLLTIEHLRQLEENLNELGRRWYSGDALVTDEFLQVYCIAQDAREAIERSVRWSH